ncbi:FHA domain-containing protein, partial [Streptomyces chartreusis]
MQIRLTVVDPLAPPSPARGRAASCDVLVTAPAGTALAAVASALASSVAGDAGTSRGAGTSRSSGFEGAKETERGGGPVVLYAGAERLDDRRSTLGEPPLTDGAVLSLGAPAAPEPHPELDDAPTQLHVVAGPDAGGVHLLHGGEIRIGRSADADVPLDDPDVSRLHCAVTVATDGRVSVADLGSTNGTTLDGARLTTRQVRFAPGALLRIGESALRLTPAGGPGARMRTEPDGEGHVRVPGGGDGDSGARPPVPADPAVRHTRVADGGDPGASSADRSAAQEHDPVEPPIVPLQGGAPRIERHGGAGRTLPGPRGGDTHGAGFGPGAFGDAPGPSSHTAATSAGAALPENTAGGTRKGTPLRGTDVPPGVRRRGGLSAWARRLAGGRPEQGAEPDGAYDDEPVAESGRPAAADGPRQPETWPDPASLLLTALGPGPRLWERSPGHAEALTVRLGTADRTAPDGTGLLPAVPVTADLREVGALGLAGPRERLAGLARAVLAQLAALHSPDALEVVLLSVDRARPLEERTAEWAWLGWLPHVRPGHGQDCRLLLAYDREQATARTEELLRRLEDMTAEPVTRGGDAVAAAVPDGRIPGQRGDRRPSWARDDDAADVTGGFAGPYTVVVVDGDPGGSDVREAVARLAQEGPRAGIHVVCLAETASASPASPVTETYEAACTVSPTFRECGAVALLSGDVATALRLMRVAHGGTGEQSAAGREPVGDGVASDDTAQRQAPTGNAQQRTPSAGAQHATSGAVPARGPVGHGTVAAVDAVSLAWAERFARALAPLRTEGGFGERHARVSVPLPQAARLLDELGLARATPASLMARWADAAPKTTGSKELDNACDEFHDSWDDAIT